MRCRFPRALLCVLLASDLTVASASGTGAQPGTSADVAEVYAVSCAPCHGVDGTGDGPIARFVAPYRAPAPRNFSTDRFKLRSTPSGSMPTDADLLRTITRGIPRYMPGFGSLDESIRRGLVDYIKGFSSRFAGPAPTPLEIPHPPPRAADAVSRGADSYQDMGCPSCHGAHGRGDGPVTHALRDASGRPLAPTDLAQSSWFKGGSSRTDLYRTLVTGFDGTPMPGYADVFRDMEPTATWDLIEFIQSLSRDNTR